MTDPSSKARARGTARLGDGGGTWMLFRSGSVTRVDVGLHDPGEGGHSAKAAYVVKECDTAMQDAAERGRLAALEWIARRCGTAAPAYRVSFDLPGVRSGENVGGASGGLAFAVAVARAVRAAVGGAAATDGGAIAAAGELASGLSGGPVRGVQGIEAKIEGALACLPAGSRLLYPRANDPDVSAGLRKKLRERGIEAMAVESADGAFERIFPSNATDAPAHPGSKTGLRHGFLSTRSGAATPRRIAVAGLVGVAGVAAVALLIAGYGQGDGRWPFGPNPKDGAAATSEPGRPAEMDGGFEDVAGPDTRSPEGSEGVGLGAAPGTSAGVDAPLPREPGDAAPAFPRRVSAPAVSPEVPPSGPADTPSPEAPPSHPDGPSRKVADTFREQPDKGFD